MIRPLEREVSVVVVVVPDSVVLAELVTVLELLELEV
jgi:hypothetical protein